PPALHPPLPVLLGEVLNRLVTEELDADDHQHDDQDRGRQALEAGGGRPPEQQQQKHRERSVRRGAAGEYWRELASSGAAQAARRGPPGSGSRDYFAKDN